MADNTYIPKYFELYELLPPELYVGDLYTSEIARQRAFASYFDTKLLITIDKVRDIIGKPLIRQITIPVINPSNMYLILFIPLRIK